MRAYSFPPESLESRGQILCEVLCELLQEAAEDDDTPSLPPDEPMCEHIIALAVQFLNTLQRYEPFEDLLMRENDIGRWIAMEAASKAMPQQ